MIKNNAHKDAYIENQIKRSKEIKRFIWEEIDPLDDLFEMTTINSKRSGVSHYIWAGIRNKQHADRIKITNHPSKLDWNDSFVVSVEDNPKIVAGICELSTKELKNVFEFVKLNKDLIIKYSNHEMDTEHFLNALKKV